MDSVNKHLLSMCCVPGTVGHSEQDGAGWGGTQELEALREGKPHRIMGKGAVEKASLRRGHLSCSLTEMWVK